MNIKEHYILSIKQYLTSVLNSNTINMKGNEEIIPEIKDIKEKLLDSIKQCSARIQKLRLAEENEKRRNK